MTRNLKKKHKFSLSYYPMIDWAKELFPICRSITGSGVRKTLEYFKKINPEFHQIRFKSGKKVFDWVIPLEWSIKDGFIKHLKTLV